LALSIASISTKVRSEANTARVAGNFCPGQQINGEVPHGLPGAQRYIFIKCSIGQIDSAGKT
jgi:hypothetical protein